MNISSLLRRSLVLALHICAAVAVSASAQSGAATPDALVDAVVQSIEERNLVDYDLALDSEFVFYLAPEDVENAPGGAALLERGAELAAVQRLFSGQAGTGPDGQFRPGVQSISVAAFPLDSWSDGGVAGPEFAGTQRRRWAIDFDIRYTDPTLATIVSTEHDLFVIQRGADWQLFAWREASALLKTLSESATWGSVKLGYAAIVIPTDSQGWSDLKARW